MDQLEARRKALHVAMLLELQRDAEYALKDGVQEAQGGSADAERGSDVEYALQMLSAEGARVEAESAQSLNDDHVYRACLNRALECKHVTEEVTLSRFPKLSCRVREG